MSGIPVSKISRKTRQILGIPGSGTIPTGWLQELHDKAEQAERNCRSQTGPMVHWRHRQRMLTRADAYADAVLEAFQWLAPASYVGSIHGGPGEEVRSALADNGMVECRSASCSEILGISEAFRFARYCQSCWKKATDPNQTYTEEEIHE